MGKAKQYAWHAETVIWGLFGDQTFQSHFPVIDDLIVRAARREGRARGLNPQSQLLPLNVISTPNTNNCFNSQVKLKPHESLYKTSSHCTLLLHFQFCQDRIRRYSPTQPDTTFVHFVRTHHTAHFIQHTSPISGRTSHAMTVTSFSPLVALHRDL